jgi:hypothetical protein
MLADMRDPYSNEIPPETRGFQVSDHGGLLGRIAQSMGIDKTKIVDERSFKSAQLFVNKWLTHRRRKVAVGLAMQKMAVIENSPATGSIFIAGHAASKDRLAVTIGDVVVEHVFTAEADIAGITAALWSRFNSSDRIKALVVLRNPANGLIQLASQKLGSVGCLSLSVKTKGADLKITTTADHLVLPQLLMPLVAGAFVAPNGDLCALRAAMPIVTEDAALAKSLIDSERAVALSKETLIQLYRESYGDVPCQI